MLSCTIALVFLLAGTETLSAQQTQLTKLWETDSVFKVPESVLFDEAGKVLYVTNIDGEPWGADGRGSVGKLASDGKLIEAEWVTGLQAPKGMGLYKGNLYVADLSTLVVIDVAAGRIVNKISLPGAEGLNDVTIDKNGVIYVSDSKIKKVFRVSEGRAEIYLENLKGPNGLLAWKDELYLLDAGSLNKVNRDRSLTLIADGMEGGTDGVENTGDGNFLVSCWAGALWSVQADGTKELLLDTRAQKGNTADIGYDAKTRTLFVPTFWNNTVIAYRVR